MNMNAKMKMIGVVIVVLLVGLAGGYAIATFTRNPAPTRIMILTNYENQKLDEYPLSLDQAKAQGYQDVSGCIPWMGYHYAKVSSDGQVLYPILLFNSQGQLIGIEFESLNEPQNPIKGPAQPPWEDLKQGHPGMEFEHWTLHIYWISPGDACPSS